MKALVSIESVKVTRKEQRNDGTWGTEKQAWDHQSSGQENMDKPALFRSHSSTALYPSPLTVTMICGSCGSSSIFSRSLRM